MKRITLLSFVLIVALVAALAAQPPAGGQGGGRGGPGGPGAGGPGGGGGGRGAGGGGGGRAGGGRGAAVPPPPAALQAVADSMAAAINKQDAAALTKMLTMDAVYLDEDGHAPPATVWAMRITTGMPAKVFTITDSHGQMLDDNSAWLSFNYTLAETFQGAPKTISGTASLALKKVGSDWMIAMVHGALKQNVAGMTQ